VGHNNREVMEQKKIQFAIIGCGRIAQRHAEHIDKLGKLVAVCDIIPEKAEALAKKYNADAYTKIDELLKNVNADVISICTPNGLHALQSIKALNTGFHVL
jgi:UDP-N-acetyl-2-amino-2-deoxyglucuronate dehydrogenase